MSVKVRVPESLEGRDLARIHCAAFPGSMLTLLGGTVVERYYAWQFAQNTDLKCAVADVDNRVVGFCVAGGAFASLSEFLWSNFTVVVRSVCLQPLLLFSIPWELVARYRRQRLRKTEPVMHPTHERRTKKKAFWLHAIAVDPALQRSGVGTELIRWLEHAAIQAGCQMISLAVEKNNDRAIVFYERLGWVRQPNAKGTRMAMQFVLEQDLTR